MNVHILATCRNPELLPGTLLVFDTLRVGFPEAQVTVHGNNLEGLALEEVKSCCLKGRASFIPLAPTIHHVWIESLLTGSDPFFLCDTDIIFWKCFDYNFEGMALAGRLTPKFYDNFTKCVTMPRLHTSLLYIDPKLVCQKVKAWMSEFPVSPFNPIINLIHPVVLPPAIFHDTCSLLYAVVKGYTFGHSQLESYDHLHGATFVDLIESSYPGMRKAQEFIYQNPLKARGLWKTQQRFYHAHEIE